MVDSGAFSAWKTGTIIDIGEYADFLLATKDVLFSYVNLDVVTNGLGFSPSDYEDAARQGWKNYKYLRRRGLEPMPVYHRGERRYWLEKMLDSGSRYVGIGGVASGVAPIVARSFLDSTFAFLCGGVGWPPVRIHGFGVAAPESLFRYPWYSVDSTTWRAMILYGKVFIPRMSPGRPYDWKDFVPLVVTSGNRKSVESVWRYDTISDSSRKMVNEYFRLLGIQDFNEIRDTRRGRCRMMWLFFQKLLATHKPESFLHRDSNSFWGASNHVPDSVKRIRPSKLKFFYGVAPVTEFWRSFLSVGIKHRLVSYPYLRKKDKKDNYKLLRRFVITGKSDREETVNG